MHLRSFIRLAAHTQLLPVLESGEETLVGGQAVIEGVMMRSPHSYCVAVRKPNGELITEESPLPRVSEKYPAFKLPVLRGIGTLGQAMWLGVKALRFSANASLDEGDEAKQDSPKEIPSWMMTANLIFSFVFFIALYKLVPLGLTTLLQRFYPSTVRQYRVQRHRRHHPPDHLPRISVHDLSRWTDIHRVFEYHGAEHKVVFNFESGKPVNVENAQSFSTWHPRCGTSFLLVVMILSTLVYMAIPVHSFAAKFALRIVMLPVIVGLSYELIRFAAKRRNSLLAMLTAPGLWLQRITTQPPSDDQTAVAIRALDGAMELEKTQGGELVIA